MRQTMTYLLVGLGLVAVFLGAAYFLPWKMTWKQDRVVTVTGTAVSQKTNEVARFSAGVNAVNDNKEAAVKEVNDKINSVVKSTREFGIPDADIKTQNMSIYQMQESEPGSQRQRMGQWSVNNTVEITLRDATRAQALTELLSASGANNVYGPNFGLDEALDTDVTLINEAIANAKEKAEAMAAASGKKLGQVLQVNESGANSPVMPMYDRGMGGGGAEMLPGSTSVSKSVTVTFELR